MVSSTVITSLLYRKPTSTPVKSFQICIIYLSEKFSRGDTKVIRKGAVVLQRRWDNFNRKELFGQRQLFEIMSVQPYYVL
jgi:hypothetical protein